MPLICFASPKGGVGKSTFAANIAGELAAFGHRVVGLDLDPQATFALHFGGELDAPDGFMAALYAALRDGARPRPTLWQGALRQAAAGLGVLPHGRVSLEAAIALSRAIDADPALLTEPLRDLLADPRLIVIVDMPPGPSPALAALLPLADLLVTVLLADATSLALIPAIEAGQCYGHLSANPAMRERFSFVINQWDHKLRLGRAAGEAAARHFGARLLGVVDRDDHVAEAVGAQRLLRDYAPSSKAACDFAVLAEVIDQRVGRAAARHARPAAPVRARGAADMTFAP